MIRIEHKYLSNIEKLISISSNNSSILTSIGFSSLFNENYFTLFLHLTKINEIIYLFIYDIINSFLQNDENQIKIYGRKEILEKSSEFFDSIKLLDKVNNGIILTGFLRQ